MLMGPRSNAPSETTSAYVLRTVEFRARHDPDPYVDAGS